MIGIEKIRDCTGRHRAEALAYWQDKRQIGFVVTLAGKRNGKPATHDFHVMAGSVPGAIRTAVANNFILDGKERFVSVRLTCPCDACRGAA